MTIRAIDCHVHHMTGDRATSDNPLWQSAKKVFSMEESPDPISYFKSRNMIAVIFDVDASTSTGEHPDNNEIADLVKRSEGTLIGFATVDPWNGKAAIDELERCRELGFRGLKVQPVSQRFQVSDERFKPLWDYCQSIGWPVLVHTGTSGVGAGRPGGGGLRLRHGQPVPYLDDVAAEFPRLQIIAAHFGWPWYLEMLAVARHKGNVYIDLSGWAPKYFPKEVLQYCNSVMPHKFLFGSDFPLLTPDRWMEEFDRLDIKESVRKMVLYENASQLLDIPIN